jgi:hypothetical protein
VAENAVFWLRPGVENIDMQLLEGSDDDVGLLQARVEELALLGSLIQVQVHVVNGCQTPQQIRDKGVLTADSGLDVATTTPEGCLAHNITLRLGSSLFSQKL